jgi:hypothetical protein
MDGFGTTVDRLADNYGISALITRSVFIQTPTIDESLWDLGGGINLDLATMKYLICLFIAYPASLLFRYLPNSLTKHIFSLTIGIIFMQWIYGRDWIHSFISIFGNYLICIIAPRKHVGSLCMLWSMGYMTLSHFYRMCVCHAYSCVVFKEVSGFDFTGTQMVLTMKLSSFGYNYSDGSYVDNALAKNKSVDTKALSDKGKKELNKNLRILEDRKKYSLNNLPNVLEYFGYMFCFTCLLAGPAFEYKDYIGSVDGSSFLRGSKKEKESAVARIPSSSYFASLKTLGIALLCLIINLAVSTFFPLSIFYKYELLPKFIFATEAMKQSKALRYLCAWIALVGERCKFYFAWKMAEGSSVLAGFGFEGYDDNDKEKGWSGVQNVDIVGFETGTCMAYCSRTWNMRTQQWLQKYTYDRFHQSLLVVYFVSALWHGLYPGFFAFFMSAPIFSMIERLTREKINPLFEIRESSKSPSDNKMVEKPPSKQYPWYYNFICWFFTSISMNYIVQFFSANTLERVVFISTSYDHLPHIIAVIVYIVLLVLPASKGR